MLVKYASVTVLACGIFYLRAMKPFSVDDPVQVETPACDTPGSCDASASLYEAPSDRFTGWAGKATAPVAGGKLVDEVEVDIVLNADDDLFEEKVAAWGGRSTQRVRLSRDQRGASLAHAFHVLRLAVAEDVDEIALVTSQVSPYKSVSPENERGVVLRLGEVCKNAIVGFTGPTAELDVLTHYDTYVRNLEAVLEYHNIAGFEDDEFSSHLGY
ncbi:hypothetical protein M885DRAFT_517730 [Pelagophyceae sp. CCMP2097]|nr:hypothetical protein M885DRAFT_517730 [Pelagophyceae sp. CCMP2097]